MFGKKHIVSVVGVFCPDYIPPPTDGEEKKCLSVAPEDQQQFQEDQQRFQEACMAIGKALAETGHPILLCIADWNSYGQSKPLQAADFVVAGAESTKKKSKITLYRPKEAIPARLLPPGDPCDDPRRETTIRRVISQGCKLNYVKLTEEFMPTVNDGYPESFPSVDKADAIIMISGENIHESVACVAHHVKKEPVVAIPSFGGAAKRLYYDLFRAEYDELATTNSEIQDELGVLEGKWHKETPQKNTVGKHTWWSRATAVARITDAKSDTHAERANRIVHLTDLLCRASKKKNEHESKKWTSLAAGCIAVFVVWAILFAVLGVGEVFKETDSGNSLGSNWRLSMSALSWAPLILAAVLGMLLRTISDYRSALIIRFDWTVLFIDIMVALLLAVAFGIFFFFGGWSLTGEMQTLVLSEETARIIVGLSLIGLAAGLLLPVQELSTRLQTFMSIDKADKPA